MSSSRVITVLGATGRQGGSVVRAIAADPDGGFVARAVARDKDSARAKELSALGVEVVEADLDDRASLRRAFDGAHGAFVVTNFWEPLGARSLATTRTEREQAQARNAAEAAAASGLRHVIWSTLDDTRRYLPDAARLEGGYPVPHADGKADADAFFRDAGVPTTFVNAPMYFDMLLTVTPPRRAENGAVVLALPIGSARVVSGKVENVGLVAYGVFRKGDAMIGRTVPIASQLVTGEQFADGIAAALGEPVQYVPLEPAALLTSGMPDAAELANMFQFFINAEKDLTAGVDFDRLRRLGADLQPFADWAVAHRDQFRALVR
ncbi:NmrA/HSCARG family protein [Micromonospora sp. WMMD714]|uniref:NmrA/HSCARG family protein n=1 Tax=Micromonospora sp. WMMD714 TaxID=3016097 RepID=UPI00249CD206|nr:NmrA/HSCARG family protein [Micromonospora sp. WMMD714]WFE66544.1 NmrA/HSCARG family protein [Micromonospora sp. WMMD714]